MLGNRFGVGRVVDAVKLVTGDIGVMPCVGNAEVCDDRIRLAGNVGEFGLVMIRRTEDGDVVVLGEIEQDIPLIESAARKLLG